jgi:hypothetical protein
MSRIDTKAVELFAAIAPWAIVLLVVAVVLITALPLKQKQ